MISVFFRDLFLWVFILCASAVRVLVSAVYDSVKIVGVRVVYAFVELRDCGAY